MDIPSLHWRDRHCLPEMALADPGMDGPKILTVQLCSISHLQIIQVPVFNDTCDFCSNVQQAGQSSECLYFALLCRQHPLDIQAMALGLRCIPQEFPSLILSLNLSGIRCTWQFLQPILRARNWRTSFGGLGMLMGAIQEAFLQMTHSSGIRGHLGIQEILCIACFQTMAFPGQMYAAFLLYLMMTSSAAVLQEMLSALFTFTTEEHHPVIGTVRYHAYTSPLRAKWS